MYNRAQAPLYNRTRNHRRNVMRERKSRDRCAESQPCPHARMLVRQACCLTGGPTEMLHSCCCIFAIVKVSSSLLQNMGPGTCSTGSPTESTSSMRLLASGSTKSQASGSHSNAGVSPNRGEPHLNMNLSTNGPLKNAPHESCAIAAQERTNAAHYCTLL
jgi:hypothetical protein